MYTVDWLLLISVETMADIVHCWSITVHECRESSIFLSSLAHTSFEKCFEFNVFHFQRFQFLKRKKETSCRSYLIYIKYHKIINVVCMIYQHITWYKTYTLSSTATDLHYEKMMARLLPHHPPPLKNPPLLYTTKNHSCTPSILHTSIITYIQAVLPRIYIYKTTPSTPRLQVQSIPSATSLPFVCCPRSATHTTPSFLGTFDPHPTPTTTPIRCSPCLLPLPPRLLPTASRHTHCPPVFWCQPWHQPAPASTLQLAVFPSEHGYYVFFLLQQSFIHLQRFSTGLWRPCRKHRPQSMDSSNPRMNLLVSAQGQILWKPSGWHWLWGYPSTIESDSSEQDGHLCQDPVASKLQDKSPFTALPQWHRLPPYTSD